MRPAASACRKTGLVPRRRTRRGRKRGCASWRPASVQRAREGAPAQFAHRLGLLVDQVEQRSRELAEKVLGRAEAGGRDVGEVKLAFELPRYPLARQGFEALDRESSELRQGCEDLVDGGVDGFHGFTWFCLVRHEGVCRLFVSARFRFAGRLFNLKCAALAR